MGTVSYSDPGTDLALQSVIKMSNVCTDEMIINSKCGEINFESKKSDFRSFYAEHLQGS